MLGMHVPVHFPLIIAQNGAGAGSDLLLFSFLPVSASYNKGDMMVLVAMPAFKNLFVVNSFTDREAFGTKGMNIGSQVS
jgi:hypothetical protein